MSTQTNRSVLLASLILSTAAVAQRPGVQRDFLKTHTLGDARYAQGTLTLKTHAERGRLLGVERARGAKEDPRTLGASTSARGDAKIFGRRFHVFDVKSEVEMRDGFELRGRRTGIVRYANLHVAIAGRVMLRQRHENQINRNFNLGTLPNLGLRLSRTFTVGPVPVSVSIAARMSGNLRGSLSLDPARGRIAASVPMNAFVQADASAGIGGKFLGTRAEAGVRAVLQLLNTSVTPRLSVTHERLSGVLSAALQPLTLRLNLFAKVFGLGVRVVNAKLTVFSLQTRRIVLANGEVLSESASNSDRKVTSKMIYLQNTLYADPRVDPSTNAHIKRAYEGLTESHKHAILRQVEKIRHRFKALQELRAAVIKLGE